MGRGASGVGGSGRKRHDNLRAALEWCQATEEGREAGLRAAGALAWFWIKRGHLAEGWRSTIGLLAAGTNASAAARGRALAGACSLAKYLSDSPAQAAAAEEALALGREAADPWLTAFALLHSGTLAGEGGDPDRAEALLEEGLSLARQLGDRWLAAELHQNLAYIAEHRGDYERARTLHQEALDRYRELEDMGGIGEQHMSLGWLARAEGNDEQAKALWSEALALWRQIGERSTDFLAGLRSLADLALDQGDPDTARAYHEEALAIAREMNHRQWTARALVGLARAEGAAGNLQAARTLLEESDALDAGNVEILMEGGHVLLELGDYAAARSRYEAGLALRRERGHGMAIAWALLEAGHAAWLQGEPDITQSYAVEAMDLFQRRNMIDGMLAALENLGMAALAQEPGGGAASWRAAPAAGAGPRGAAGGERAARLIGAAEALRAALGVDGPAWWRRQRARMAEAVRAAALDPVFAAAWAAGRAMSFGQAIDDALGDA